MNETLNLLAKNIQKKMLSEIKEKDTYGIDPITIILIISVIVNIIRVIQECNKKEISKMESSEKVDLLSTDVKFRSTHSSFLTRWRLRSIIKSHLDKKQYRVYGEPMIKALLEAGKNITTKQIIAIMEHDNV